MAKAVEPITFDESGSWRWHIRADSIRATTDALSSLWGRVALEARHDTIGGAAGHEFAHGDPRLASHMSVSLHTGDVRVRTRTSVLTLVVIAPRPEMVERAMATVSTLAARHPSRAVVLSPTDPDGPASFEAHVYASCQLPERGSSEICTEEIPHQGWRRAGPAPLQHGRAAAHPRPAGGAVVARRRALRPT